MTCRYRQLARELRPCLTMNRFFGLVAILIIGPLAGIGAILLFSAIFPSLVVMRPEHVTIGALVGMLSMIGLVLTLVKSQTTEQSVVLEGNACGPRDPYAGRPSSEHGVIWERQIQQHQAEIQRHQADMQGIVAAHSAAITFAGAAIRGLLLINGGAAIAILAFIGHLASSNANDQVGIDRLTPALLLFGYGAFAGALTAGASYLAQTFLNEIEFGSPFYFLGEACRVLAVVFAVAGYATFIYGLHNAAVAFPNLLRPVLATNFY